MKEFDNRYSEKKEAYYEQTREEIIDLISGNVNRILDVGCSNGNFAKALLDKDLCTEAFGIEPFEDAYNEAKEKLTKVYFATVEDALDQLPDKHFDIIFFNEK